MKTINMKFLSLLALALAMAAFSKVEASAFYTTVRSTAVQIVVASSYTHGVEMLSVSWSSASTVGNDQFIAVIDTDAVENDTSGLGQTLQGGTTLQGVAYGRGRYPIYQHIVPPIVLFSTITAATNGGTAVYNPDGGKIDLKDSNGCGRIVNDGIEVLQPGVAYGTVVTIEWRPRPVVGPCKDQ